MRILFLGEGSLDGSARYLAAILTWAGIPFDHQPDQSRIAKRWCKNTYAALILSDYRYASWTPDTRDWAIQSIRAGCGLMMLGGWASFSGQVGGYAGTAWEELLPVRCLRGDDRVNRPAILTDSEGIAVVVNGYHKTQPKRHTTTHLTFKDLNFSKGKPTLGLSHPALVTGSAGQGRSVAFMTDCAPHWGGGLIDWGRRRVRVNVPGAGVVEVGESYLTFFKHWIGWACRRPA